MLPVDVLTDLVRSYTTSAQSVVPQFLAASFEMLRESQSKMMENLASMPNPMQTVPGFEALQRQQQAFLRAMTAGWPGAPPAPEGSKGDGEEDMDEIRRQLAELQKKIAEM